MKQGIIYTSLRGLLIVFLPVYTLSLIVFYISIELVWPPKLKHYLMFVLWTLITLLYLIFAYRNSYFELTKHEIKHTKGKNILYYPYKDILYIDEKHSARKSTIRFVTKFGDERYLTHDKKRLVYAKMLEKTPHRITKEKLLEQFPKLKL